MITRRNCKMKAKKYFSVCSVSYVFIISGYRIC